MRIVERIVCEDIVRTEVWSNVVEGKDLEE